MTRRGNADDFKSSHFCLRSETLTSQHISHDGIPEKRDVVDDVPEALEVGEKVVDSVGRRLQGHFEPGEELGCGDRARDPNHHTNVPTTKKQTKTPTLGSLVLTCGAVLSRVARPCAVTFISVGSKRRAHPSVLAWLRATWVTWDKVMIGPSSLTTFTPPG